MNAALPLHGIELTPAQELQAKTVHEGSLVIDCGLVLKQDQTHFEYRKAGGVHATNHTVTRPDSDLPTALREIDMCSRWIDANPGEVLLARTVADIQEARASGRARRAPRGP